MKKLLFALLMLPLSQGVAHAQAMGDAAAGKTLWATDLRCADCHGGVAEGAFGPDLAGRGLNVAQVKQAIRKPWGIMPAFAESQLSDQEIANLTAYFASLPKVAQPGPWKAELPANAPTGQRILVNVGCAQCHGNYLNGPRDDFGAVNPDMEWFKKMVYSHSSEMLPHARSLGGNGPTRVRMGNFNPERVTEAQLQEIYNWVKNDIGYRAPMRGRISKGEPGANGVTYNVTVENFGMPGKGLTAEDLTVRLMIPAGTNVVSATGAGYKGVRMDAEAKAMVAEWSLAKASPKDQQSYTITLSKAGTQQDNLRGNIRWNKPAIKPGPFDQANIAAAPL
jgi:mono/diheme cytochrome c family protein